MPPFFETGGGAFRVVGATSCPIVYPCGGTVAAGDTLFFNDQLPASYSGRGGWIVLPQNALFPGSEYRPYWTQRNAFNNIVVYANAWPGIAKWQAINEPLGTSVPGTVFSGLTAFDADVSISRIVVPALTIGAYDSITTRLTFEARGNPGDTFTVGTVYNGYGATEYTDLLLGPGEYYLSGCLMGGFSSSGPNAGEGANPFQVNGNYISPQNPAAVGGLGVGNIGQFFVDVSQDFNAEYFCTKNAASSIAIVSMSVFIEKSPYNI